MQSPSRLVRDVFSLGYYITRLFASGRQRTYSMTTGGGGNGFWDQPVVRVNGPVPLDAKSRLHQLRPQPTPSGGNGLADHERRSNRVAASS
jgi:hypothetical protein